MNKKLEMRLRAEKRAEKKLLPCPFCGDKACILPQEVGVMIKCRQCGASKWTDSTILRQVLATWNWRNTKWIRMLTVHNIPGSMYTSMGPESEE